MPDIARPAPLPTMSIENVLAQATVTAHGAISLPLLEVEALRAKPGDAPGIAQIVKTLRNADPQTVAAIAALLQAIDRAGWKDRSFADWGVIGCPRFVGRMVICNTIWRFFGDPKYSINPHVIPNFSLHSLSGAASIALGMHGQNLGVGGGPENLPEGLLASLSILAEGRLPGIWLLLSECDPEPTPDEQGNPTNAVSVHAVALAIQLQSAGVGSLRLVRNFDAAIGSNSIRELAGYVGTPSSNRWTCAMDGLGDLELTITRDRP
jgi:hypothetical protein